MKTNQRKVQALQKCQAAPDGTLEFPLVDLIETLENLLEAALESSSDLARIFGEVEPENIDQALIKSLGRVMKGYLWCDWGKLL